MDAELAQLEAYRASLTGHCYRMLGSVVEADDAVQETMVRAWRSLGSFEGRSSLRTWLYRIATNVCFDALAARRRRSRPMEEGPAGSVEDVLVVRSQEHWLEPVPEAMVIAADAGPAELAMQRQSIRLAFVAALQRLPARQRAALLLTDVLGCSAAEVAEALDTTVAAANSALQRARATMARRGASLEASPEVALSEAQQRLLERYVEAFERYDVSGLQALLREDASFNMPPYALWLRGPEAVGKWLRGPGAACRGSRLLPTRASGLPAFGQYRRSPSGGHRPWALVVLELDGDRIGGWTSFLDTDSFFPRFGLPAALE